MERILEFLKLEYVTLVNRVNHMFTERLDTLRKEKKDLGKYLIGISDRPWNEIKFIIGTPKDYKNYDRKVHEIMIVREI